MALLTPALADRGRVVRRIAVGPRVEGSSRVVEEAGEEFACRLVPVASREVRGEGGGVRLVERANLIAAGADVRSSDEVEVAGVRWRIVGAPEAIVTRRLGAAQVAPVERLAEPPATEVIG